MNNGQQSDFEFDTDGLLTPALAIYPAVVIHNARRMIALLGGNPKKWRVHLKTVKLAAIMKLLVEEGISDVKCATTLELLTACEAGFRDVLVAFPHTGANAERVVQIAKQFGDVRVSALIESAEQIPASRGTPVGVFIDINPGMDRTGIERSQVDSIVKLVKAVRAAGLEFRGLHFYDGHATEANLDERTQAAHKRYDDLMAIIAAVEASGSKVHELVTTGTPALPCALSYAGFQNGAFVQQVSPGTVVYNDLSSLKQLPKEYDLRAAALVVSRVISHPRAGIVTCDAGHKAVSVDSGVPSCAVLGHAEYVPMKPSEEHLPIAVPADAIAPPLGTVLYLLPRHVCPTVNNANYSVLVEEGAVTAVMEVTARGHEAPLITR